MNNKVLDISFKPEKEKIFFGEFGHYIRIDNITHDIARKLKEASEGNTWFTKEIDFKSDKTRFQSLPEDAKRAFKLNIAYQTLMDSGVTSGISFVMSRVVTSSIWNLLYARIAIEEAIHAESYSYGLSEVFGYQAAETLDLVYNDEFVKKRMGKECMLFENVISVCLSDNKNINPDDKKKSLLSLLLGIYFLEGIKFPFSFLVTFIINNSYNNAISGFTKTIKLIAHDELSVHVVTGKHILNILSSDEQEGFKHLFDNGFFKKEALSLAEEVVQQEIEWAKYLFDNHEVAGINSKISENFIKYWANIRLKDIGINDNPYMKEKKTDIIEWFNNYRNINKQNAALQETSNTSYQKGVLKNDL